MAEATPTTAAPAKLSWDAPDGKHYEGTAEELFKISSERYDNIHPEFERIKRSEEEARRQLEEATRQLEMIQQATTGTQTQQTGYNAQTYWQLMQKDPLEAQRYLNQHDPEYQRAVVDLRTTRQNQEASIFRAEHPEFEVNEANTEKLARVCMELFPGGDVVTSRQMTAAYALAFGTQKPPEAQTNAPPPPPPQSASTVNGQPDVVKMDQNQLKAYILQLESQGR